MEVPRGKVEAIWRCGCAGIVDDGGLGAVVGSIGRGSGLPRGSAVEAVAPGALGIFSAILYAVTW